jgi:hypothetical protein
MKIPNDTAFLPYCGEHHAELVGTPKLVHPNPDATAIWEFDLSDMLCLLDGWNQGTKDCSKSWELRA